MTENRANAKQAGLACVALSVLTLAVFWRVQGFDFVSFDDPIYIYQNPDVQKGLSLETLRWAIFRPHIGHWHPLTWLSHMLDIELFGMDPGGHHAVNLLFHILNTLLLFLVLTRITGTFWRSAAVAALFAIHPLHVEPVAWVSARKDVLSTLFWCLTVSAYAAYTLRPGAGRYLCMVLWFIIGLSAKPMLVTLPFLLLLLDFWPLQRLNLGDGYRRYWMLVREKIPLFACSALSCFATFYAGRQYGVLGDLEKFPLWPRIANAAVAYVAYIVKMVWPLHLAVFYQHPYDTFPVWTFLGSVALLVAATVLVLRWGQRYRYLAVGWFWYVGTLVPVIGLIQIGGHAMADRYVYVPLAGLFILAVWGLHDLALRWRCPPKAAGALAGGIVAVLAVCAWFQAGHWRDSETLYRHAVHVTANNARMYNNLGTVLKEQARFEEAKAELIRAIEIKPDYYSAHNNLGLVFRAQTRFEEAKAELIRAIEIRPDYHTAYRNLGLVLEDLGDVEGAASHYRKAVDLDPDFAAAYGNLGALLVSQKRFAEAAPHFSTLVQLNPEDFLARCNLGVVLAAQGEYEAACEQYRVAIELKPEDPVTHFNLALALANRNQLEGARAEFSKTLELDPNYSLARRHLKRIEAEL